MALPEWNDLPTQPVSSETLPDWDSLPKDEQKSPQPSGESPEDANQLPSWDALPTAEDIQNNPLETFKAYERKLESGITLGASDIIANKYRNEAEGETKESIEANQEAHPVASILGDLTGTSLLLAGTGGLGMEGLAAKAGLNGLKASIAANAGAGALLSGSRAVSNDLALGDPNLNASKIAADAGTSALWGALFGGITTAVLGGASPSLKGISNLIKGNPDLSVSPEALGPLDKIRIGMFSGAQGEQGASAIAQKVSDGLNSLHKVTSMEDLSALAGKTPEGEAFDNARSAFLKEFGKPKSNTIDPEEIVSFITNPASKNSTQQTIAFNNYFKSIKDLSKVPFTDANVQNALKEATNGLDQWSETLGDYATQGPHVDVEYGEMGKGKPYSTTMDVIPGKKVAPNGMPGVQIGAGETSGRVSSYGNESVSPFEYTGPSLEHINQQISDYQNQVSQLMEKQNSVEALSKTMSGSLEKGKQLGNQLTNLENVAKAKQTAPAPLGAGIAIVATKLGLGPLVPIFNAIRNYSGEGGLYRLGDMIAHPLKVLEGVGATIEKTDKRIGDKARLIFTGASAQARPKKDQNE